MAAPDIESEAKGPVYVLGDLLNLSLGTPEVGAVNFNILKVLLRELINGAGLSKKQAALNEPEVNHITMYQKCVEGEQSVGRLPGVVATGDSGSEGVKIGPRGATYSSNSSQYKIPSDKSANQSPETARARDVTTLAVDASPGPNSSRMNLSNVSELEEKVHNLERHLQNLYALPENKELLAPDTDSTKVTDMWQHIQLNNRVAATEAAVQKLASLIEDLMKKLKDLEGCCGSVDSMKEQLEKHQSDLNNMQDKLKEFAEKAGLDNLPSFMQTADTGTDPLSGASTANAGTGVDGANNTSSTDTNTENWQQDGSNQTDGTGTGATGTSTNLNDSSNNGSNTESGSRGQDGADSGSNTEGRGSNVGVGGENGGRSGQNVGVGDGTDAGIGGATVGADGKIIGADGKLIGTVDADGRIIAPDGTVVGTLGPDGKIIGADGKLLGTAGADGKVVGADGAGKKIYGPDGKLIGTVGADGRIIGPDGKVIGTLGADGKIYGPDGKLIGTVGADGRIIGADGNVIGSVRGRSVGSGAGLGGPNGMGAGSGGRSSRSGSKPGGGIQECLEGMCSQTDRAMASRGTFSECNQSTNTNIPVCDESDLECKRKALEERMKNCYCDIQRMQRTIMCDMQKRMECMYQKLLGDMERQNTPRCPPEMCNQGVGRCGESYKSLTPSPRSRSCSPCSTVGSAGPCSPRSLSPRCCPTYPTMNQKVIAIGACNQMNNSARISRRMTGQLQSRDPSPSTGGVTGAEPSKVYEQQETQTPQSSEVPRNSQGFEVPRTSKDFEVERMPRSSGVQRTSRSYRKSPCRPQSRDPSPATDAKFAETSKAAEYVQRASQISEVKRSSQTSEVQRASQTPATQQRPPSSEMQRMSQGSQVQQAYRASEVQGRTRSSENRQMSQGFENPQISQGSENQQISRGSELPRISQGTAVQSQSQGSQVKRASQCSEAQKANRNLIAQRTSQDSEAQRSSQISQVQRKSQSVSETPASVLAPSLNSARPTSPKVSAATNSYIPNETKSPKKSSAGNNTMRIFEFTGTEIRPDDPKPSPANSLTSANRPKSASTRSQRSDPRYSRNEVNQTEAAADASATDGLLIDALQKDCKKFVLLPKNLEDFRSQVTKQGKVPTVFDEKEVIEKLFTLWDAVMALKQNDESLAVRVMKLDSAVRCLSAVKTVERQSTDNRDIRGASVGQERYSQANSAAPEKPLGDEEFPEIRDSREQTSRNRASSTTCLSLQRKDCYMLANNNCDRRKFSSLAPSTGPRLSTNSVDVKMRDLDMRLNKTDEVYEMMKNLEGSIVTRDSLLQTLKENSSLMDNKVNLDDFASAMEDLTGRMQNMAIEVYQKNDAWKAMLEHLADEIHAKLDKGELATIRAYFKSHLKGLENKVNHILCELSEPDPAGTRKKLLKDYNCISCDRRTNISGVTNAPLIPYLRPATAGTCFKSTNSQRTIEMPRFSDRPRTSTTKGNRSCRRPEVNYYAKATACCPFGGDTTDMNQLINRYTGGSHTCFSNAERLASLRKRSKPEFLCDSQEGKEMNPPETQGPLEDETDFVESEFEQQVHDTVETTNLVSLQNEQEEIAVNNE